MLLRGSSSTFLGAQKMKTREEFAAYVSRLEDFAERSPASYRLRLGLLAALGYAYLLLLLIICIAAVAGTVVYGINAYRFHGGEIQLIIFLTLLAYFIVRSVWVKLERPRGIPLGPAEAPDLHPVVEDLRVRLSAPTIHHVLLTEDYNAAVVQIPRLGLFGWQDNYLLLGLPLMQSLDPDEFCSVLAHELGHVSANHGSFAVWIWRVRHTWVRLTEQLQRARHRGAFLVNWFSRWYAPRFMAYSFALVRANEREADEYSARLTSPETAARALAALAVHGRSLADDFWPAIYRQVNEHPSPPAGTYARLLDVVRRPPDQAQADTWLREALAPRTHFDDTHPALGDRLAALGYRAALKDDSERRALLPRELSMTAAERLLGEGIPRYAERLSQSWTLSLRDDWSQRHAKARQARDRLSQLAAKSGGQPLTREEAWEQVHLTYQFVSSDAARPLVSAVLTRWPDFPPALYTHGLLLLDQNDPAGLEFIEKAMSLDPTLIPHGCEAAYRYLRGRGQDDLAETYWNRAAERQEELDGQKREATTFARRDRFLPHNAPQEAVDAFRGMLEADEEVAEGYLVRKVLRSRPDEPVHVLGIVPRFRGHLYDPQVKAAKLLARLKLDAEPHTPVIAIVADGNLGFLHGRMRKIEGSLIYKRRKR